VTVYILRATDDELLIRENALASKALRNGILRIIPSDVVEDALDRARATMANKAAKDPEATRKKVFDTFASIGVQPPALKHYVGHDMAAISNDELIELNGLFIAIRDGETTWPAAVEARLEQRGETFKAPEPAKAKGPAPRRENRPAPVEHAPTDPAMPASERDTRDIVAVPAARTQQAPAAPPPPEGPREPETMLDMARRGMAGTIETPHPDELEPRQIDLEMARLKLAKSWDESQLIMKAMADHRAAGRISAAELAGVKDECRQLVARFEKPKTEQA